jgi:eukaryotic-like serine/threonine-protein kinase
MNAPLTAGNQVAPGYDVIEHLRRGRNLDVYDVWSEERACRCVVKALRPDRIGRQGPTRRLLEEGRMLRDFTHPHIVRAYEVIEEPLPLFVMETLSGETLGHMIDVREAELSAEEVAHLGLHLGSAIRYLHAHGWLHLDLKPSNVISECGRAKLIDLSVARPPGPAHGGVGTLYYMAPEQARGGELGTAADVWGIGTVLFEAATGEPAFDDPDADELDDAESDIPSEDDDGPYEESDEPYESEDPPTGERFDESDYPQLMSPARRADELRPLPPELADLIAACLEPTPERRPSLPELLPALQPIAGLPPSERRYARPGA